MKDPAYLFYSNDFLGESSDLNMEERGQFITMLCLQHIKGELTVKSICTSIGEASPFVMAKFVPLENGSYRNEWLASLIEKRAKYTESRRNNAKGKGEKHMLTHMHKHMENENEDVNENVIEDVNKGADKKISSPIRQTRKKNIPSTPKRIFRESGFADFELFKSEMLTKPGADEIDLYHYHSAIMNWSDIQDAAVMRTDRGWIGTALTWITKDVKRGTLQKKRIPFEETDLGRALKY